MRYSILGPVGVARDGQLSSVNAARERTVLAVLLLHANHVVTAEFLIEALWEESPPSTARAQIHNCVSRVRRMLVLAGAPPDTVATVPAGYRLSVVDHDADHLLFDRLVHAARGAAAAGDLVRARSEYRAALSLWRGEVLADVCSQVARRGAVRLAEERFAAVEECLDIELRLGLVPEVLPELTDLAQRYPLRERLLGQFMTALAAVGRDADALAAYRTGRRRLAEELGIEPGPELQDLHRRILNREPVAPFAQPARLPTQRMLPPDPVASVPTAPLSGLGPAPPGAGGTPGAGAPSGGTPSGGTHTGGSPASEHSNPHTDPHTGAPAPAGVPSADTDPGSTVPAGTASAAPPRTAAEAPGSTAAPVDKPPPPRCVPRPISDFTGRDDVAERLAGDIDPDAPVVVTIDGMAGAGKTTFAIHLATRLGERYPDGHLYLDLHGHSDSAPLEPAAALNLLLDQLGVPTATLPPGLAERAARWRTEVAHRRVVVVLDNAADSRQVAPLLPGASHSLTLITSRRRLTGLPDARRLSLDLLSPPDSVRLLTRIVGEAAVAGHRDAAAEVAALCGHLPLALRIAGARLASRPSWTVEDLARRLRAADPSIVELAVEGSTIGAAFTLSYRQLPPPAQRTFRLLGLHPGADIEAHAVAALADLTPTVAQDLLEELVDVHLVEQPAAGRYRLHDLIREYAHGLAQATDPAQEQDAALVRLLDFYLHTALNASTRYVRTATLREVQWGPPSPRALSFDDDDAMLHWSTAEWSNGLAVARRAADLGWYRYAGLLTLAQWPSFFRLGLTEHLVPLQRRVLAAADQLGDRLLIGMTHHYLAGSYSRSAMLPEATHHLEQALAVWKETGRVDNELAASCNYGLILVLSCRYAEALEHCARAAELSVTLGARIALTQSYRNLGEACLRLGRRQEAVQHLRMALAASRLNDDPVEYASRMLELGRAHRLLGHPIVAGALTGRGAALNKAIDNPMGAAEALSEQALVHLGVGRLAEAVACQQEALDICPELHDPVIKALVHNNVAEVLRWAGDRSGALRHSRTALQVAEQVNHRYEAARAHAGVAATLADDPAAAAGHWERALGIFTELGTPESVEVAERLERLRGMQPA